MTRVGVAALIVFLALAGCSSSTSTPKAAATSSSAAEPATIHASGDPGGALSCTDFLAASTSGTAIDGFTPIAWTTQILEQQLAAHGQPVPARVEVTSDFFSQVVMRCAEDRTRNAPAVAVAVYLTAPARFA